jgi:hypothetical protein
MKRILIAVFAVLLLCQVQSSAVAEDQPWPGTTEQAPGLEDYLAEIVLRPLGAISNIVGLVLFVAASPITLLASIEEPHDAVANSFNGFVLGPYRYTFRRPIGEYRFRVNAEEAAELPPQE